MTLRIATRASELARWQATHVAGLLAAAEPSLDVEIVALSTEGDRRVDVPLHVLGGKGTFVTEVQAAVRDGRADVAVHSAKDLPGVEPDGLVIAAFAERGDARDALVGEPLDRLVAGSRVGSGSQRRRVQLLELVPDLVLRELRGNIATRVSRVGELDAVVVALAALQRLGMADLASQVFDPGQMLPQVGQGALAIECGADAGSTIELLAVIDHAPTRRCVETERAFLAELGGDCSLPAGAHATLGEHGLVQLSALLADDHGDVHRHTAGGRDGPELGRDAARRLRDAIGNTS